VNQAGPFSPAYGAEKFGFKDLKSVSYYFETAHLGEDAIKRGEAMVAKGGALNAETGIHTGRSPNDKFTMRDDFTEKAIWWENRAMTPQASDQLHADMLAGPLWRRLVAPTDGSSLYISALTALEVSVGGVAGKPPARQVWARNFRRESKWMLS
jgi:phosphoenolpyruvate carboxykinase (ATP)